jgi:hypothetical protein
MMTTPAGGRDSHRHPAGQLGTAFVPDELPPDERPLIRTDTSGVGDGAGDGSGVAGSAITLTRTLSSIRGGASWRWTTKPSTPLTMATTIIGAITDDVRPFTTSP